MSEAIQRLLVSAYALMLALMTFIAGPLSNRIGRPWMMLRGTLALATVLYLHAFVDSYQVLLIVRALAGVAGGMSGGAAIAHIGDFFRLRSGAGRLAG